MPDEARIPLPTVLPEPVQPKSDTAKDPFASKHHGRKPGIVELSLIKSLKDFDEMIDVMKEAIAKEEDPLDRATLAARVIAMLGKKITASSALSSHIKPRPRPWMRKKTGKYDEPRVKPVPMMPPNANSGGAPPRGGLAGTVCTHEEVNKPCPTG